MFSSELERLITAARANDRQAQYDLGLVYLNGDSVPQNSVEAYFWLSVCSALESGAEKIFWSPSPDELAADASLDILDEATLCQTLNRITLWLAEHGDD